MHLAEGVKAHDGPKLNALEALATAHGLEAPGHARDAITEIVGGLRADLSSTACAGLAGLITY